MKLERTLKKLNLRVLTGFVSQAVVNAMTNIKALLMRALL
jgi:hypothetical protein